MSESTLGDGRRIRARRGDREGAAAPRRGAAGQPISVLVVDDESANIELVRAVLDQRGWRFVEASDGGEALAIVHAEHPDIVITDILMPSMDGFEFVRRLREAEIPTPVLFYTATYHQDAARSLADAAGATAIVYKDGSIADLVAAVDAALGAEAPSATITGGRPAFDEQHIELLTDSILDKARRLQISNLRQAALIRLCVAVASERNTDRMLVVACRSARDLAGTSFALLTTYDERGELTRRAISGRGPSDLDAILSTPDGAGLLRLPHETGDVVQLDGRTSEADRGLDVALDLTHMVGIPVRSDGHSYGSLWVSSALAGGAVDGEERDLLTSLASHVAISLENERLADEVRSGMDLLQAVVNGSEEAVFVKDSDGRYLLVNDKTASIIGRPRAEIIGRDDRDLLPPGDVEAIVAVDREVVASGAPRVLEEVIGTGGVTRSFLSTKMPLIGPDGSVQGLIGYAVDITERKALENRVRQAQKLEAVGRLASGTAHDFNNILTAISGFIELVISSSGQVEEHIEDLRAIRDAAERGSAMTRQLLIFGRQQTPRVQRVDMNDAVRDVLRLARPLVGESTRVETRLAKEVLPVMMDPLELEQVVLNLLLNARDATSDGGRVVIRTGRDRTGSVLVSVHDNGEGMSEETRARMFEPFFSTKPSGHGTGLGLAVVHGIVTEAGGAIEVETRPGEGSTFTISLPESTGALETDGWVQPVGEVSRPAASGRILVVEDEPLVRSFVAGCLRRDGYEVVAAASVAEGVAAIADRPESYSALLCDMILGDGRGPTVAEAVRVAAPDLPIVFMSGYVERDVLESAIVADSAFLAKPFGADQLRRVIHQAVDGTLRAD